jgi:prepilin-type N-terminal cleavage/methylation domain-containing protein
MRGFTLVELLVAMTITVLIVSALVTITSVAMNTWNRSRSELRASRQAKAMVDAMAKDFESAVVRRGNTFEWLAVKLATTLPGSTAFKSSNAAEIVLLTSPTDRYKGDLKADASKGEVAGVGYLLEYKDPTNGATTGGFPTFVLNRHLVDPSGAFLNLSGKPDLLAAFTSYQTEMKKPDYFICENVYQFTLAFHVEVSEPPVSPATAPTIKTVVVPVNTTGASAFRIKGTGLDWTPTTYLPSGVSVASILQAGRVKGVELSLTVLTEAGANRVKKNAVPTAANELAKFLAEHSHNYSKFIPLPLL